MAEIQYRFTEGDFKQAFQFAVEYHLDPSKSPSGRTSGEPRGLGAVLDAFTGGKLVEIGAVKMLKQSDPSKNYLLNFDIVGNNEVKNEPDITGVLKDRELREPNCFVEIKRTFSTDRWLGCTEEQLSTMEYNADGRAIFFMYVSLNVENEQKTNHKCNDLVGMYLKNISDAECFEKFSDINVVACLEFILNVEELKQYGSPFLRGDLLYETALFPQARLASVWKQNGVLRTKTNLLGEFDSHAGPIRVARLDGKVDEKFGDFTINGSFDIYEKKNPKSQPAYIKCRTDVQISSDVFGSFQLAGGKLYKFNMFTLGRGPVLKRNNLWISKNMLTQLIQTKQIKGVPDSIKELAEQI